jgi:uncharacterized protein (TIGR03086 family)
MLRMAVPESPAERHRAFAEEFADVISRVQDWNAPTPVDGWIAADVPAHLIEWLPHVLDGATGLKLADPPVDPKTDPAAAWQHRAARVQAVLDDEAVAASPIADGRFAGMLTADMIDRIYTTDVFLHRWDLARSNDLDPELDPDFCEQLLTGMSGIEDLLRSSGQYGDRVPVPDTAPVAERLAGFLGRDPSWKPQV